MKQAILDISNVIKDYTFGLYTPEECWNRILDVVLKNTKKAEDTEKAWGEHE